MRNRKAVIPLSVGKKGLEYGLEQYTPENCGRMRRIFDDLIAELIAKGADATEAEKIESFKKAIEATNVMDEEIGGFIETGEREDLCELTSVITIAANLDPQKYGGGEGLASEWREW